MQGIFGHSLFVVSFSEIQPVNKMRKLSTLYKCIPTESAVMKLNVDIDKLPNAGYISDGFVHG